MHKEIFEAKLAQMIPHVFQELHESANPKNFLRGEKDPGFNNQERQVTPMPKVVPAEGILGSAPK